MKFHKAVKHSPIFQGLEHATGYPKTQIIENGKILTFWEYEKQAYVSE